jgi:hypothetical protein
MFSECPDADQIQFAALGPGGSPIISADAVACGLGCPWLMIYPPDHGTNVPVGREPAEGMSAADQASMISPLQTKAPEAFDGSGSGVRRPMTAGGRTRRAPRKRPASWQGCHGSKTPSQEVTHGRSQYGNKHKHIGNEQRNAVTTIQCNVEPIASAVVLRFEDHFAGG